ncbi:3D domain-containing protein [Patescibacteria group bacterium]|nr:3D domain-containing protein [Patescibacteria group bacterium]MBU1663130.1 3D domain-containing protein [Patescibacteria group bacterium]MBU1933674.1 3D domain-containing protein [Patescibacteria group bacterium]MBU2008115.1 3D domain-containing protein [Patescibacteria group bacterium]MBU2233460.1 3D domain-containing protein [Patescibacteria group bacterium]
MQALKKNHNKIITPKQAQKVIILLVFIFFFEFLLFPAPSLASQLEEGVDISQEQGVISSQNEANQSININVMEFNGKLPESASSEIKFSQHFTITAYNSEAGQTDNSPCITANGFNVCENGVEDTIAANFLPFGSKVKIPGLFGNRVFVVRDRMNKRFSNRVDVWMIERPDAIKFGVKVARIEVLK